MTDVEALQIYEELVELLPVVAVHEFPRPDDPALLDGVHELCLRHGTHKMQQALDWLETSKDPGHRFVAAGFRRRLDAVTAVLGFNGEK